MSNSLRSQLSDLSTTLVDAILAAARSAPLDELIADPRRVRGEPFRNETAAAKPLRTIDSSEQPPRPLVDDAAKTLHLVVLLLRGQRDGLRAEQIGQKLGVSKEDMSRILKQGLVTKKISSKGQRRATTYFAAIA
jgi:hypothetical protein